ncbi:MAG TPA: ABC transporter permease [Bryobacteraceae bacterium]|nr:ABC transporter permease [Bryobacteraceae bacterium]
MRALSRDFEFALRLLLRNPGFTTIAVLCLALGMGATTAVFTVVDAVVFRPLPYHDSHRLVRLYTEFPTFPNGGLRRFPVSPPEFREMRENLRSSERVDAWQVGAVNLTTATEPIRVTATFLTGTLFDSLGIRPRQGRWLTPADDREGAPQALLISAGLWRRAFGGAAVLGREVKINGLPATIVGIMPQDFQFPPGQVDVSEVWAPLQLTNADLQRRGNHRLGILAKLRHGVTLAQARAELTARVNQWGQRGTQNFHTIHPATHPALVYGMQDEVVRTVKPAMLVMLGAVVFVLLIACVNVATLLLARAEARQKEISVRVAMGSGAVGLVRQFLAEGILIAVAGAILGLAIAIGGVRLLLWAGADTIPRAAEVGVDRRVLAFTAAVLLATAVMFGLAPLAQALARNTHETLKSAAGRTSATAQAVLLRRGLVVAELALALVLLIACGLMLQAFWRLQAVDPGFDASNRLTARIALPRAQYDDAAVKSFVERLEARLAALPGVISSTVMRGLPPDRQADVSDTNIEGYVQKPGSPPQNVDFWQFVGHRFFETIGARMVEGRLLDERDTAVSPPSVVINETMARTFWPGQSALGHRIQPGSNAPWYTIVGVVADLKNGGTDKPTGTEFFIPYRQAGGGSIRVLQVLLRTAAAPAASANAIRAAARELDASLPVANVRTMDDVVAAARSRPRFLSVLLSFFTLVAVGLAAIGVYGVISYSVARRTTEFGIRMAIGADSPRILRMVMRQGVLMGGAGVLVGIAAALWLTRFMKAMLFGIQPLDLPTFAGTVVLLLAITLLASWRPARRATRVDPAVALRYE